MHRPQHGNLKCTCKGALMVKGSKNDSQRSCRRSNHEDTAYSRCMSEGWIRRTTLHRGLRSAPGTARPASGWNSHNSGDHADKSGTQRAAEVQADYHRRKVEGKGTEGRGDRETLNQFLLSRPTPINLAQIHPSNCPAQKGSRGNESVTSSIGNDEQ
jgi:hypothetical protein